MTENKKVQDPAESTSDAVAQQAATDGSETKTGSAQKDAGQQQASTKTATTDSAIAPDSVKKDSAKKDSAKNSPAKKSPAQKSPPGNRKSKTSISIGRFLLLGMVLVAILAGAGWAGYSLWQMAEKEMTSTAQASELLQRQLSELKLRVEAVQAAQQSKEAQQGEAGRLHQQLQRAINNNNLRLDSQHNRLVELGGASRSDWKLAEAEYLARLAHQRLYTERATANAEALLTTADTILQSLNDPALVPVRQQLADDITALRMARQIDREGIYLELSALSAGIEKLRLLPAQSLPATAVDKPQHDDSDTPPTSWQQRLGFAAQDFIGKLGQLVEFRRHGEGERIQPLLPQAEEPLLRYNLQLMLEQAQLSLLREQSQIYRLNLQKAGQLLRRHFALDPQAATVIARIAELGEMEVVQQLPDITGSVAALNNMINLRHNRHPGATQTEGEPQ